MSELTCLECSMTLTPDNISPDHNQLCTSCCDYCYEPIVDEQKIGQKYAEQIRKQFTYFAFNCSCQGRHEDCRRVLEDTHYIVEMRMLNKIADWLEKQ